MGLNISVAVAWLWLGSGGYLPNAVDKHGWALRLHYTVESGPYLVGEDMGDMPLRVTLMNRSKEVQRHDPLPVARLTCDLDLAIALPDSRLCPQFVRGRVARDPFTEPFKLRPSEFSSFDCYAGEFGYWIARDVGEYRMQAEMKVGDNVLRSPVLTFWVVELPAKSILESQVVRVEGPRADVPIERRIRPVIQQIVLGKRTFLIYRLMVGAEADARVSQTFRLAELPHRVGGLKVEGAYGAGKPLTITYHDETSPNRIAKLVISSTDGRPWTEKEEQLLQERNEQRTAPLPRLVNPKGPAQKP